MTSEVQIDKGVPIPEKTKVSILQIMKNMAVGDSFLVKERSEPALRAAAVRAGIKVTIRNDAAGLRRCWRVG